MRSLEPPRGLQRRLRPREPFLEAAAEQRADHLQLSDHREL
jgi:hypothetical protein